MKTSPITVVVFSDIVIASKKVGKKYKLKELYEIHQLTSEV